MADKIPTNRELEILKVLWTCGEASVREVYEQLSRSTPIVQSTVQAFLRTMEDKGLVKHRTVGRTFIYSAVPHREDTKKRLVSRVLQRVFDGAMDQLVQSVLSLRDPTPEELARLQTMLDQVMLDQAEGRGPTRGQKEINP